MTMYQQHFFQHYLSGIAEDVSAADMAKGMYEQGIQHNVWIAGENWLSVSGSGVAYLQEVCFYLINTKFR